MAKKIANKKQKSFEQTLWDTADKLRGTVPCLWKSRLVRQKS